MRRIGVHTIPLIRGIDPSIDEAADARRRRDSGQPSGVRRPRARDLGDVAPAVVDADGGEPAAPDAAGVEAEQIGSVDEAERRPVAERDRHARGSAAGCVEPREVARWRARDAREFLGAMFGNTPARWSEELAGDDRLRFTLNTLTRTRFVAADGTLEFTTKDGAAAAPPGHFAWFDAPGRRTAGVPIAFGHWSSLGFVDRPDLLGLDTGCVWGGRLTAVRIDDGRRDVAEIACRGKPHARS